MDSAQQPARPTFGLKLAFGFGAAASASWAALGGLVLFFYNQVVGVPAHLVSLALGMMVFIDALWDPVIGQTSDRLKSKWGRRHPFILAAIVLVPIAILIRWNPPTDWSHPALFGYILGASLLMSLSTSLFDVPASALAPELAPDYHDRTVLMSYRWFFLPLGSVVASVLIYGVFLRSTPEHPVGQLNPEGYGPLALAIAAFAVVAMLVLALGTRHKIPVLHKPEETTATLGEQVRDVIATLRNWNFGVAVVASAIAGLGAGLTGGLTLYFNTFFWGLSSEEILILTFVALIAAPIAALLAPVLGKRFGKKRPCMAVFFVGVLMNGLPMFLRLIGFFPDNDSPLLVPTLFATTLVTTVLGVTGFILVSSMIADIVEDSQVATGRRSEGLLITADSLPQKLIASFSTLAPGILLSVVNFPERAQPGPETYQILVNLAWIYLPLIVLLSLLSVSTWGFFRIDERRHSQNLAALKPTAAE